MNGALSGDMCVINYPDNSVYIGVVKNNSRHGVGEIVYPDGKQYRGQWKNDVIHGIGVF